MNYLNEYMNYYNTFSGDAEYSFQVVWFPYSQPKQIILLI
jgi:hypothetical protein